MLVLGVLLSALAASSDAPGMPVAPTAMTPVLPASEAPAGLTATREAGVPGVPLAVAPLPPSSSEGPAAVPPARERPRWYGWQILIPDALVWLTVSSNRVGLVPLVLTGPVVHGLNGNLGSALVSLALRAGVVFGLPYALGPSNDPLEPNRAAVVGLVLVELLDVLVLGHEPLGTSRREEASAGDDALPATVVPVLAASPHGGLAGVAAAF